MYSAFASPSPASDPCNPTVENCRAGMGTRGGPGLGRLGRLGRLGLTKPEGVEDPLFFLFFLSPSFLIVLLGQTGKS